MTTHSTHSVHTPTISSAPRRSVPHWIQVILGGYLALSPLWTSGAPSGWFVTLGLLVAAAGLWGLRAGLSTAPDWTQIVLAALIFLAPWLGGFVSAVAAAWTAWLIGLAVAVLAAVAMSRAQKVAA